MPALADLAVGVALLMIAAGLYLVYFIVHHLSAKVSIFGWHPLDIIGNWLHDAVQWIVEIEIDQVKLIEKVLTWLYGSQLRWVAQTVSAFFQLHENDKYIIGTAIPHWVEQSQGKTSQAVHAEAQTREAQVTTINGEIHDLTTAVTAVSVFAHDTLPADYHTYTDQKTQDAIATADADARADVNALQGEIEHELSGIIGQLTELQKATATTLPADIARAAQTAANEVAAAKQSLVADLSAQAKTEQQALSTGLATIQGQVSIEQSQIGSLEQAVGISIPVAIGGVAAQVVAIASEIDNCMVSACAGPHSLENELNNLASLFTIGGELSFLGAAVKDPIGTADALNAVLGPWLKTGESLLDELLSL